MYKNNSKIILEQAIAYMEENLTTKMRVQDVATHCGVSASWLEKVFVKITHHGVMRHFLDLKLEYAANKVKEGYRIQDLAKQLQFSSSAHLSLAFKKRYGVSPIKYRTRNADEENRRNLYSNISR